MNVDKGMMTLVDEARQAQLLAHLQGHLVKASHASGGSAGNSMIATAQFGGPRSCPARWRPTGTAISISPTWKPPGWTTASMAAGPSAPPANAWC